MVWYGMVCHGMVCHGMVWYGIPHHTSYTQTSLKPSVKSIITKVTQYGVQDHASCWQHDWAIFTVYIKWNTPMWITETIVSFLTPKIRRQFFWPCLISHAFEYFAKCTQYWLLVCMMYDVGWCGMVWYGMVRSYVWMYSAMTVACARYLGYFSTVVKNRLI